MDDHNDPVAALRARHVRHERLPMPRLVDAVKGAGCTVSPSRMRFVNHEVNYGGMNIGTIAEEDGVPVLELSRRETPRQIMDMVSANVERTRAQMRAGMARGMSLG